MTDNLQVWNDCVAEAKRRLKNNSSCGYQIIRGSVLREAQKAYFSIVMSNSIHHVARVSVLRSNK